MSPIQKSEESWAKPHQHKVNMAFASVAVSCVAASLLAHSNLIIPVPRNAVDNKLWPWKGGDWDGDLLPHNATCE